MGFRSIISVLVVLVVGSAAVAQVSPDEAMAKLKAKQQQREAERSQPAKITVGEVEDMREQIRLLKTQLADLQRKQVTAVATTKPALKHYNKIELGMTRAELMIFLNARPKDYHVIGEQADSATVNARGGPPVKSETIRISVLGWRQVQTGTIKNVFGGDQATYGKESFERGKITVKMTDGVVSSFEGEEAS